jgi:hypothetical protein
MPQNRSKNLGARASLLAMRLIIGCNQGLRNFARFRKRATRFQLLSNRGRGLGVMGRRREAPGRHMAELGARRSPPRPAARRSLRRVPCCYSERERVPSPTIFFVPPTAWVVGEVARATEVPGASCRVPATAASPQGGGMVGPGSYRRCPEPVRKCARRGCT